jgi:hypothetical protein
MDHDCDRGYSGLDKFRDDLGHCGRAQAEQSHVYGGSKGKVSLTWCCEAL